MNSKLLAVLIAASLWQGPAFAQAPAAAPQTDEATRAELAKAREELHRAAEHMAELSLKTGEMGMGAERDRMRIEMRKIHGDRPVIGIIMAEGDNGAVAIAGVTPESAAAKANLRAGDTVVAVNGKKIAGDSGEARIANARELIGDLKEGDEVKLTYRRDNKESTVALKAQAMSSVMVWHGDGRALPPHGGADGMRRFHGIIDPEVEMEIARIAPMAGCGDDPERCRFTHLSQAFRWSGLSLAELNDGLGRYFGADHGVLVLRDGKEGLDALKAGDVIVSIEGTTVNDPRSAMRELREREAGSKLKLDILRDKHSQSIQVTAPALRSIEFFAPPAPPPPPAPPAGPPAPPAPPIPPKHGSAAAAPLPALPATPATPPLPAPPGGIVREVLDDVVFVGDDDDTALAADDNSVIY